MRQTRAFSCRAACGRAVFRRPQRVHYDLRPRAGDDPRSAVDQSSVRCRRDSDRDDPHRVSGWRPHLCLLPGGGGARRDDHLSDLDAALELARRPAFRGRGSRLAELPALCHIHHLRRGPRSCLPRRLVAASVPRDRRPVAVAVVPVRDRRHTEPPTGSSPSRGPQLPAQGRHPGPRLQRTARGHR